MVRAQNLDEPKSRGGGIDPFDDLCLWLFCNLYHFEDRNRR
jgi:hypothetical protein